MADVTATSLLLDPTGPPTTDHDVPFPVVEGRVPESPPGRIRRRISGVTRSLGRPTSLVVAGAMVVGTAIRVDIPRGLWLDEAISVSEARMPYVAMIHRLADSDVHPPLYFTVLWASTRLIGFGETAVRVPSIVLGVLLIPLVYLLGKEAYDRRTGAVAAVLVSVAPYLVWFSQEARMYAMLMVLGVLALWAQLRILRRGGWYPWILYTVASAAMIGTQYFGIWQLITQQLVFIGVIAVRWRRHQKPWALLRAWLISAAVLVITLVPIGLLMREQFANAQNTGQAFRGATGSGPSVYAVMTNLSYALLGFHSTAITSHLISLWPVAMLAGLVLLGRHCTSTTYLLVTLATVPVVAMMVLSDHKASLGDVRYQSTIVPIFMVLLARTITSLATKRRAVVVILAVLVAGMSVALVNQQYSSANPRRYDFREALQLVDRQAQPGDVILYDPVNDELNDVTTYYSPRVKAAPLPKRPTATAKRAVFVVASSILMDPSDRKIFDSAIGFLDFRHKRPFRHWVFPNVQVWEYR